MNLSWLPNAISLMRIALVAPILWFILEREFVSALALFVFAGFSDAMDGFLAKQFNWRTRLGALLDPVADKLLIAGVFVVLVSVGLLPLWLAAVVVLRDIIIVGGATAYNFLVQPVQGEPTRVSKLNTALELLLLLVVLLQAAFELPLADTITALGAGVLVTVVISGIDYVWSWSGKARNNE